jgi:hypothetical protein
MNSTTNTTTTTIEDDHSADRSSSSSDKPWGDIVLACFTVQLVTLSGVFLAVATRFCVTKHKPMIEKLLVPGFAAGEYSQRKRERERGLIPKRPFKADTLFGIIIIISHRFKIIILSVSFSQGLCWQQLPFCCFPKRSVF